MQNVAWRTARVRCRVPQKTLSHDALVHAGWTMHRWEAKHSHYHPREELLAIIPAAKERTDDDAFLATQVRSCQHLA